MIKSLFQFNNEIKGVVFLIRHIIYSLISAFYVYYYNISSTEPLKWIVVIPMMYLMAVNDYNRLFTLYKKHLPIFMIMLLASLICGVFPQEMFYLSITIIVFRFLLAFNIGNKQNHF